MPIYEYECTKCSDTFEMIQGFSDKPLKKCKKCGGLLHKLVSECSFQLKGSGWYVTDYGKSGSARTEAKKETTSESKSESTPASQGPLGTTESKSKTKSKDAPATKSKTEKA